MILRELGEKGGKKGIKLTTENAEKRKVERKIMSKKIDDLEKKALYEDDSPELPPSDIIAYNELRSCADLYRMHLSKVLEIRPEFQRDFVWKDPDQTRFIDSLVKQLPIPSMCFSLDYKTQQWQVIDGLQRMSSIIRFLSDDSWKLSNLDDIDPNLAGLSVGKLMDEKLEVHRYFTRVQNLTIPITVLRCDYSKSSHTRYLFTIFHRLNTGGMKLNNQEIRNCIYSGSFNNLLKELDNNSTWRAINKMQAEKTYRFTKQELILRLFALHDSYLEYTGRLARFLNDYMDKNKNIGKDEIAGKTKLFEKTIDLAYRKVMGGRIPKKITITLLEAIIVGVSFNIRYLQKITSASAANLLGRLQQHKEFSEAKLSEGLSGKPRVIGRIKAAKQIFSGK